MNKTKWMWILWCLCPAAGISQAPNKVDTVGNIGVGTLVPANPLSVQGNDNQINIGTATSGQVAGLFFSDGPPASVTNYKWELYKNVYNDMAIHNYSLNATVFYIKASSGNVGINTQDVSAAKLVIKNGVGTKSLSVQDEGGVERIGLGQEADYAGNYLDSRNMDLKIKSANVAGTGGNIIFETGVGAVSERMRLNKDGNLCIGTTGNENGKLTIKHNLGSNAISLQDSYGYERFSVGQQAGYAGNYINSSNIDLKLQTVSDGGSGGTISFETGIGTRSEKMKITPIGNVGIGVANPTEKLAVNGNIVAQKIRVTQTGWSDYVFSDDYKLQSLSALEIFVKQHKHLPEIPSAKEVEKNGINIGDNQALLLKKIEELTLYIIELKKENDLLKEAQTKIQGNLKKHGLL